MCFEMRYIVLFSISSCAYVQKYNSVILKSVERFIFHKTFCFEYYFYQISFDLKYYIGNIVKLQATKKMNLIARMLNPC